MVSLDFVMTRELRDRQFLRRPRLPSSPELTLGWRPGEGRESVLRFRCHTGCHYDWNVQKLSWMMTMTRIVVGFHPRDIWLAVGRHYVQRNTRTVSANMYNWIFERELYFGRKN